MEFYTLAGHMALGSRLRRLADLVTSDAEKIFELYGSEIDPRWFPVIYMLMNKESAGITELATDIGLTHPAVSQVVREMTLQGVIKTHKSDHDARVNHASLTTKGKNLARRLPAQCEDVSEAVSDVFSATGSDLWAEIEAIEYELMQTSLYSRVVELKKRRDMKLVKIVPYDATYKTVFKQLNEAWIKQHWALESSDYHALEQPYENIIDKGGYIAIAIYKSQPVGTCALIKRHDGIFELAKMAVDDSATGLGIGFALGQHIIDTAKKMGAQRVYLESNTVLTPALSLYRKLGFKRIPMQHSPYARCNIQMEFLIPAS